MRENIRLCDFDLGLGLWGWGMMVEASLPSVPFTFVESVVRDQLSLCAEPISIDMV